MLIRIICAHLSRICDGCTNWLADTFCGIHHSRYDGVEAEHMRLYMVEGFVTGRGTPERGDKWKLFNVTMPTTTRFEQWCWITISMKWTYITGVSKFPHLKYLCFLTGTVRNPISWLFMNSCVASNYIWVSPHRFWSIVSICPM